MGLELIELVPILWYLFSISWECRLYMRCLVQPSFILHLLIQPVKLADLTEGYDLYTVVLDVSDSIFVMAGSVMNYGGISDKMMDFAEVLTGHMKGGLAQVNVVLSMLMGGCSGSANADCAMQSKMLVPEMEKRGYSKAFSAAITAASSAATPVIPPGVNLIVLP